MIETFVSESFIRLRFLREALSLNKKQFSKLLNVNYRTYVKWERKEILPSIKAQKNMIELGLNPRYILGENNPLINGTSFEQIKKIIINKMIEGKV